MEKFEKIVEQDEDEKSQEEISNNFNIICKNNDIMSKNCLSCPICLEDINELINEVSGCNSWQNIFCDTCVKKVKKCPLCRSEPFIFT